MRSELSLAEACELIVDCPHNTAPVSESATAYAVGTKAISNGRIQFEKARPVDTATYERWIARATPREGDLILCREAPVGPVARVPAHPPVCLGQRTVLLRANQKIVDPRYLMYALLAPGAQSALRTMSEGSTVPHLNVADVRRFPIEVPRLKDQQRVAEVLSALDDKIDSNRRLAERLEETAAALFRARFVDFVGIDEFEESEVGRVPRGSRVAPIGDVLRVVGGGTPSTKEPRFWDGTHCWATPKDLAGMRSPILLDTARHITDEGIMRISSRLLPSRTVVLSSRAPVGYTAISFVEVAVNQGFIAIPPHDDIPSEFVLFWLREHMDEIKAHAGGTTFAEISKRGFRPLPIVVPPPEQLEAFADIARPLFDLMATLERELQTLSLIRDALLPKLVSGEIRVPDDADAGKRIEMVAAATP